MTAEPTRNLDGVLDRARDRAWSGPDHNPKVDAFLSEQTMNKQRRAMSKTTIGVAIAAIVGGGVVTAAVTQQIMSQRAKIIAEDGTEYEVMLTPTPEGAAGTFVTDDGTVYGIDMVEGDAEKTVSVDVTSEEGGTSSITLEPAAGGTGAAFIDEDGNRHEVSPDAAAGWISDESEESDG